MRKSTAILTSVICFLSGIILGFMLAPMKNGMSIGSNNGNNNGNDNNIARKADEITEDFFDGMPL